jgi:ribonuclease HI
VKQIGGQYKVKEPRLQALHGQVIMLLNAVAKYKFRHVRREENTRADELANEALDAVG